MKYKRVDLPPTEDNLIKVLEEDPAERKKDLKSLLNIINNADGRFSIFLDAAWGDGKTFLVHQAKRILENANIYLVHKDFEGQNIIWQQYANKFSFDSLFLPVYFNAWENDDFDDPLLPLLATIAHECNFTNLEISKNSRDVIASIIDSVTGAMGHCVEAKNLVDTVSGENLLDAFSKRMELRERFDILTSASLAEHADKLVIFIDELDRCRPDFAVKLLEQTKNLFSSDNVILVFATDSIQLSHTIRGVYGQRFDAEKYLERFYDMKVTLSFLNNANYLRYAGFNSLDSHNYTTVANGFIRLLRLTMRDMNRLVDKLRHGQEYILNSNWNKIQGNAPLFVADGALLPTFIVMEYDNPQLWHDVRSGRDFHGVYDYATRNDAFLHVLLRLMQWGGSGNADSEIIDDDMRQYVEMICALLFIDDHDDRRYLDAYKTVGASMWDSFDIKTFRGLWFSD